MNGKNYAIKQLLFKDNFTGYGQIMLRNGGRNGIAAHLGLRYLIGRRGTPTKTPAKQLFKNLDTELEVPKTQYRNLDSV